jgi:hypothetical protein
MKLKLKKSVKQVREYRERRVEGSLLNMRACKLAVLDHASTTRAHKFTRVSMDTINRLNRAVIEEIRRIVKALPSVGKTI